MLVEDATERENEKSEETLARRPRIQQSREIRKRYSFGWVLQSAGVKDS
jgi:hypothetical protein